MPPAAVKSIQDLIFWQYAKIISGSAGFRRENYRFIMDRFKKLKSGEIEWSTAIREYVKERETLRFLGTSFHCRAVNNLGSIILLLFHPIVRIVNRIFT